ncbi:hypothetical protein [Nonomuraea dietziae]|uniref:hypothetical protein n=1 Tax=Nonomuraea dietziae TaxID=65515 RepID=UPI0033C552E5
MDRAQARDKVKRNVVLLCEIPKGKEGRPSRRKSRPGMMTIMITRFPKVTYAALIVVSSIASILLASHNAYVGRSLWADSQTLDQILGSWRAAAALAYTSGSTVGYICAIIAGRLAAHCHTPRPLTAYLAGAILGLVQLAASRATISSSLASDLESWTHVVEVPLDPGLQHHPSVLVAMILVFVTLPIASRLGLSTAGDQPENYAMLVITTILLIAIVHLIVPVMPLLSGMGLY